LEGVITLTQLKPYRAFEPSGNTRVMVIQVLREMLPVRRRRDMLTVGAGVAPEFKNKRETGATKGGIVAEFL